MVDPNDWTQIPKLIKQLYKELHNEQMQVVNKSYGQKIKKGNENRELIKELIQILDNDYK